jgi:hypothetical protein
MCGGVEELPPLHALSSNPSNKPATAGVRFE